jgi:hypothetical protein
MEEPVWEQDRRRSTLILRGEALKEYPIIFIKFGAVRTTTHDLAEDGWVLYATQSTPIRPRLTRPKVRIYPPGMPNAGFRWKLRSRKPFIDAKSVFEAIDIEKPDDFILSGFENRPQDIDDRSVIIETQSNAINELNSANAYLKDLVTSLSDDIKAMQADPFIALRAWNDKQVAEMDFSRKSPPVDWSNVIDLEDILRQRKEVREELPDLDERLAKALS